MNLTDLFDRFREPIPVYCERCGTLLIWQPTTKGRRFDPMTGDELGEPWEYLRCPADDAVSYWHVDPRRYQRKRAPTGPQDAPGAPEGGDGG